MSTCRGGLNLRAFRLKYISSQSLSRNRSISTTAWSRPLVTPRVACRCSNLALLPRRQQRVFSSTSRFDSESTGLIENVLPICCPGCGAYSQTVNPLEPGYYSKTRKETRKRLAATNRILEKKEQESESEEGEAVDLRTEGENAARDIRQLTNPSEDGDNGPPKPPSRVSLEDATATAANYLARSTAPVQICDRCHTLKHHNEAAPAPSPSIESIKALLDESPHEDNHVYHILDAADFPMSIIPNIHEALELNMRPRNRRAKSETYTAGKKNPNMTFIVTRADLLAPTRELVDAKMGYLYGLLRNALSKAPENIRLGRLYLISCFRGYFIKPLKEHIREHRGGIWVVGKTNVGKSQFIQTCFPKDTTDHEKIAKLVERRQKDHKVLGQRDDGPLDPDQLLPPAPREDLYPILPIVSSLSGTTVSPIRIPFGRGKSEMIDLPGIYRDGLEPYVPDKFKGQLTMKYPVKNPARQTIKAGQSLILGGGLIRITPVDAGVLIAACFVPIESHVTNTRKAISMQTQEVPYPGKGGLMREGVGEQIERAAEFRLEWDVTNKSLPKDLERAIKERTKQVSDLPYRVFAGDLLIEGCGWIELSMQVRTKDIVDPDDVPRVEVFTPNGRHVGWRQPMLAYSHVAERIAKEGRRTPSRSRQPIGHKKRQAGGARRG